MGACASAPTETKTETMMMTLASEVRDLRALVVETSVRTVEETRAAAAGGTGADAREASDDDSDGDSSLPPLVENRNRRKVQTYVDSDESDSE